ncbi:hypothetical protein ACXYMU_19305 [Pontibacter sp. CAU 1760]
MQFANYESTVHIIRDSRYREEILGCHLMDQDRLPLLEERIEQIIQL